MLFNYHYLLLFYLLFFIITFYFVIYKLKFEYLSIHHTFIHVTGRVVVYSAKRTMCVLVMIFYHLVSVVFLLVFSLFHFLFTLAPTFSSLSLPLSLLTSRSLFSLSLFLLTLFSLSLSLFSLCHLHSITCSSHSHFHLLHISYSYRLAIGCVSIMEIYVNCCILPYLLFYFMLLLRYANGYCPGDLTVPNWGGWADNYFPMPNYSYHSFSLKLG
jgi:hypothetical protein